MDCWYRKILNAFIKEFNSKEYDHSVWFFGKGEFPFLAGYDLSYFIMGEYLKMNMSSPEKEVNLMPEQLLPILQKMSTSSR